MFVASLNVTLIIESQSTVNSCKSPEETKLVEKIRVKVIARYRKICRRGIIFRRDVGCILGALKVRESVSGFSSFNAGF